MTADDDDGTGLQLPFPSEDHRIKGWLSYAQLEMLFSTIYGADSNGSVSILRSRYKNFQKLGLPLARKPGRGSKSLFDVGHVLQIIMAFELSEIGISPSNVVKMVETLALRPAESEPDPEGSLKTIEGMLLDSIRDLSCASNKCIILFDFRSMTSKFSDTAELIDYHFVRPSEIYLMIAGHEYLHSSKVIINLDPMINRICAALGRLSSVREGAQNSVYI